ncbi:hypothetical protein BV25DRAFT_1993962 [Artomyces pyxidatus]|uniref:Uncharacterized protein n=1 Tax=Artomyces pyxidatus TaxID=48021 RepID=A0ACB8SSG9_9AGAM|nr:hypothetical protein BV25DRAFT_1993962 [Artomyces pyxidatus]
METPLKKLVHFAPGPSTSPDGSPYSEASSSGSVTSTSTLQYVNAQLISHGFTISPGLSLDGLSNGDSEKVVKCLFAMLSQRMEDMNRTEELSTKLRTLSYDHERLQSMHRTSTEKMANAEREATHHKSKLATATKALQQAEAAHKHTTGELQRTRTSLQAVRATHQAELKKKEKEAERMVEKWSKLSDAQLKLGTVASGMLSVRAANADILEGTANDILGKGRSLVDTALEQAEEACKRLREENTELKNLIIDIANAVRKVLHKAVSEDPDDFDFPIPLGPIDLFPLGTPDAAFERLSTLLTSLRDAVTSLRSEPVPRRAVFSDSFPEDSRLRAEAQGRAHATEIDRLQETISALRSELDIIKTGSVSLSAGAQRPLSDEPLPSRKASTEERLPVAPTPAGGRDTETLDPVRSKLRNDDATLEDATLRLDAEKASFEAERAQFMEERLSWQAKIAFNTLPTIVTSDEHFPPELSAPASRRSPRKTKSKPKSPRHSPVKAASSKRSAFRRSSTKLSLGLGVGSSSNFVPSFETEVIPSSLLPTSFVLPPPSPHSRLPPRPDTLLSTMPEVPHAGPSTTPPYPEESATPADSPPLATPDPQTPPLAHRPFPMAKPFAPRMVHAYSPAKPSPLSRILMLADSPEGGAPPLAALDIMPPPDEDDSPLREKQVEKNAGRGPALVFTAPAPAPPKKSLAAAMETTKPAGVEKENTIKRRLKGPAHKAGGVARSQPAATAPAPARASVGTKSKLGVSSQLPAGKGGARRVPIDSAEAAPIGPGWRG